MTNDTTTTTNVEPEQAEPNVEINPDTSVDREDALDDPRGNREAAKYRKQLRDAQAELEGVQGRLAAAQSALLVQEASNLRVMRSMQIRPEAVHELDASTVFGQDGQVDTNALRAQLDAVYAERPYLFTKNLDGTMILPNEGKQPDSNPNLNSFETAFRP